eukprot:TRINITY_DN3525_c0_g1_i2.p4 TRINITY_DN3525_c0_g1~~TRINITY_DN3525_c0_g1_i2.p4  ORF type:complete len:109 (-),score=38.54 TRINITY_DN3525_c0_g1_i2:763-1089(-)
MCIRDRYMGIEFNKRTQKSKAHPIINKLSDNPMSNIIQSVEDFIFRRKRFASFSTPDDLKESKNESAQNIRRQHAVFTRFDLLKDYANENQAAAASAKPVPRRMSDEQ